MVNRRTLFALLATTALLAACATVPRAPAPAPTSENAYLAIGTEPFWSLEITDAQLRFAPADGARTVVANPGGRPSFNGMRYVTDRLSVDVTFAPCSDGMSDRRYADTVSVAIGDRALKGCGGAILPPADLAGTSWRVGSTSGVQVDGGAQPPRITFDAATMRGKIACNSFTLPVRIADDRIVATGKAASTRMQCDDAAMAADTGFLGLFDGPVTIRHLRDGKLLLSAMSGATAVLERAD